MTDAVFLVPTLRLADAYADAGAPVWVYRFTWRTPVFGGLLGATHALELPFVWDEIDNPLWQPFVGAHAPRALVDAMQDAWIAFARTGDPERRRLAALRHDDATHARARRRDQRRRRPEPGHPRALVPGVGPDLITVARWISG